MRLLLTAASLALACLGFAQKDAKRVELPDGFVRVETREYSIEVPRDWTVSSQTPWGARKATPKGEKGAELGVMTAAPSQASWESLYRTSLYFIEREEPGEATPFTLGKTREGLETMSFSVLDAGGFAARRYVLVKNGDGRLLALSVRIPNPVKEKELVAHFDRMVATARFR
jgi:hypothetical protein